MVPHKEVKILITDRQVAERYDVVVRTLERWDRQPDLGFPPPVRIKMVDAIGQSWRSSNGTAPTPATRSRASPGGLPCASLSPPPPKHAKRHSNSPAA